MPKCLGQWQSGLWDGRLMTTQPNLKAITVKYGMLLMFWSEVALFGIFSAYMKGLPAFPL